MTRSAHRFGLGLRKPHYATFLAGVPVVDFVEVISENFLGVGGRPREILRGVREHYPIALHGVSMSIGSGDGAGPAYLRHLRSLADEIEPILISDHLCWTHQGKWQSHDLLPLPYTREALDVVCRNLARAQEALGRTILVENPSSYVTFESSEMGEAQFLAEVVRRSGCGLLLDVNNIYVSACNHGFDAAQYLTALPLGCVKQIHLAGHSAGEQLLIDSHDQPVCDPVWTLYRDAIAQCESAGAIVDVMIERDDAIPPLSELLDELALAQTIANERLAA